MSYEVINFGPAMVLKVMSGDKFDLTVTSWWKSTENPGTPVSPLNDLISALAGNVSGVAGTHGSSTELISSGILSPGATSFLDSQSYNSSKPKAVINWIVLDEQFKYVGGSSGFEQVGGSDTLTFPARRLPPQQFPPGVWPPGCGKRTDAGRAAKRNTKSIDINFSGCLSVPPYNIIPIFILNARRLCRAQGRGRRRRAGKKGDIATLAIENSKKALRNAASLADYVVW